MPKKPKMPSEKEVLNNLKTRAALDPHPWLRRPQDVRASIRYLDDRGREIPSDKSLTVAAHWPTLGERIRRYMKNPTLQQDVYNNPEYWDQEDIDVVFDDDGVVISPHEERYQEGLQKAKAKKAERDKEAADAARKKEQEENEAFRKRVKQAMIEGETVEKKE